MDISNANTDRIYQWVYNEPSDSYIKQEFSHGCNQSSVFLKNEDKFFKCPHCLLIQRFSLVFKCGHLSCHHCFPESFKWNQMCNYCRMPVHIKEVMTLNNDRLSRPNSLVDQMYEDLDIQCTNIGCKLQFGIDEINKHVFLTARIESFSVRLKTATTKIILIKYTSTHFSLRFSNFTAEPAMEPTAPKYSSIAVLSCSNDAYWNMLAFQ